MAKEFQFPQQIRGDDWDITVTMTDENGAAYDISGNQYWFTLKSNIDSADVDADIQVGPVTAGSPDASLGILNFTVSGALTELLAAGTYNYDLQEVSSGGSICTVLIGKVKVRKDVTLTATYVGAPTADVDGTSGYASYSGITTTTSPTTIYLGGINGTNLTLNENSVLGFTVIVVGKDTVTDESCAYKLEGVLERDTGDSTQVIGTIAKYIYGEENAAFDANVTAATNYLNLTVTAASTNSTQWAARLTYQELSY